VEAKSRALDEIAARERGAEEKRGQEIIGSSKLGWSRQR